MDRPLRRVLLIVNPASRRGARLEARAIEAFRVAGVECDSVTTRRPGDGAAIARAHADHYDAIFPLGGDGTAVEIVSAVTGLGLPVGVLPAGTGNLLARSLGIPLDIRSAVPLLLAGERSFIDMGVLGDGRRFAFGAGVGVDAMMIEQTPAALKRRIGVLAYVLTAAKAVLRRDLFVVRVTVDGEVHERRAATAMVVNFGAVLGTLLQLGPSIQQDDGRLDLCVFSPETLSDAFRVLWRLWRKDFRSDRTMLYRSGRRFRIETIPPRIVQADGELLGTTPVEIAVEPRVAHLLVPRQS